jgi:hypothetical protein
MKTSVSIGGRVVPVVILRTDNGYAASFSDDNYGEPRHIAAAGETYEAALQSLRGKIIDARIF